MGKIFYLMGKSSSGKDTIYKKLVGKNLAGFKTVILYTTRPIRAEEKNGEDYFFTDEEKLQQIIRSGRLIELRSYQTVHGVWKYFTVDDGQWDLEHNNYLMIGTLESYEKLKAYFGTAAMIPVYIEVDDGIRLQRALDRERMQDEPKYAELCRRFLADMEDFSENNIKKAGITVRFQNNDIDECVSNVLNYIESHTISFNSGVI